MVRVIFVNKAIGRQIKSIQIEASAVQVEIKVAEDKSISFWDLIISLQLTSCRKKQDYFS